MIYLNVPFEEKDQAKALGARWNSSNRHWFIPEDVDRTPFEKWIPEPEESPAVVVQPVAPVGTVGTISKAPLPIELMPKTAWFSDFQSDVTAEDWTAIEVFALQAGGGHCCACGVGIRYRPLHARAKWMFDSMGRTQRLLQVVSMCDVCIHVGRLEKPAGLDDVKASISHLMQVNNWDEAQVRKRINQALFEWRARNEMEWRLDATLLLELVPMSAQTSQKILEHEQRIVVRDIKAWQKKLAEQARNPQPLETPDGAQAFLDCCQAE